MYSLNPTAVAFARALRASSIRLLAPELPHEHPRGGVLRALLNCFADMSFGAGKFACFQIMTCFAVLALRLAGNLQRGGARLLRARNAPHRARIGSSVHSRASNAECCVRNYAARAGFGIGDRPAGGAVRLAGTGLLRVYGDGENENYERAPGAWAARSHKGHGLGRSS